MRRKIAPTLRAWVGDQAGKVWPAQEPIASMMRDELRALLAVAREARRWAKPGQSSQEFVTSCAFLRRALARLDKASATPRGDR